jgi:hypothetical protein
MISVMETANSSGRTAENITANGTKENNMVQAYIRMLMERIVAENGKTENVLNGSTDFSFKRRSS